MGITVDKIENIFNNFVIFAFDGHAVLQLLDDVGCSNTFSKVSEIEILL